MAILDLVNWADVRQHYDVRVGVSNTLMGLYKQNAVEQFAKLALGFPENEDGNYSAAEHRLGPKILCPDYNRNAEQNVFNLAGEFISLTDARRVPNLIAKANLKYLKIGVGSEISCMVNPEVCWVIMHNDSIQKADEHLKLYREADGTSEMEYQAWEAIHAELRVALTRIAEDGQATAKRKNVVPGNITYIWADAIASALYEKYHG
jgi:hypothetical protein